MKLIDDRILLFGEADDGTVAQARDVATRSEHVALMADNHRGYVMPIGGVAAYRDAVSVVGVGFDIACGNAAIRTDLNLDDHTGIALTPRADPASYLVRWPGAPAPAR